MEDKQEDTRPSLLELRAKQRLTQQDVADLAQTSKFAIMKAERGQVPMSRALLEDICAVFGLSIEEIRGLNISPRVYIRSLKRRVG